MFLIALLGLGLSSSYAGGVSGGGGGNGLICANSEALFPRSPSQLLQSNWYPTRGQIIFLETLDLIQAKLDYPRASLDLMEKLESVQDYAARMLRSLQTRAPTLAAALAQQWKRLVFEKFSETFLPVPFDQLRDFGSLDAFKNFIGPWTPYGTCGIVTLAVQKQKTNNWTQIWLNSHFTNLSIHSSGSLGALILHEWVYAWARTYGVQNSQKTRKAVAAWLAHDSLPTSEIEAAFRNTGVHF